MPRRPTIEVSTMIARNKLPATTCAAGRRQSMSMELAHYYGFDRVGVRLWQMIERPRTVRSVCNQLIDEFGVEQEHCLACVTDLLALLVRDRLVRVVRPI